MAKGIAADLILRKGSPKNIWPGQANPPSLQKPPKSAGKNHPVLGPVNIWPGQATPPGLKRK